MRNFSIPALIAAFLSVLIFAGLNLIQLAGQETVFPLNKFRFRMDYTDFRIAGNNYLEGKSIYRAQRYVAPPASAVLLSPLGYFKYRSANAVLSCLIILSICGTIILSTGTFFRFGNNGFGNTYRFNIYILILSLVIMFSLSYPFYFLFERGNVDWLVLLLFWAGIYLLSRDKDIIAGIFMGLSVCVKVYPVIIAIPLIIHKKWKTVSGMVISFIALFLICPSLWADYFHSLFLGKRTVYFRADENVSLANTLFYIFKMTGLHFEPNSIILCSGILYAIFLSILSIFMYINRSRFSVIELITLMIPFFMMIPSTAYAYEAVFILSMIPYYCVLYKDIISHRYTVICIAVCVVASITQAQVIVMEKLSGSQWFHFIPSLGVFILGVTSIMIIAGLTAVKKDKTTV